MAPMEWIWLGLIVVFLVLEASTVSLTSLWFVGGALAALIAALCGGKLWLQITLFFSVSILLLLCLRPLAKKFFAPRRIRTNAASNVGKTAIVTETIDNLRGKGAVKISGVEWSARSTDDAVIEKESVVRIVKIEGAKVCVELLPETK